MKLQKPSGHVASGKASQNADRDSRRAHQTEAQRAVFRSGQLCDDRRESHRPWRESNSSGSREAKQGRRKSDVRAQGGNARRQNNARHQRSSQSIPLHRRHRQNGTNNASSRHQSRYRSQEILPESQLKQVEIVEKEEDEHAEVE